jgi:hypothetical protein
LVGVGGGPIVWLEAGLWPRIGHWRPVAGSVDRGAGAVGLRGVPGAVRRWLAARALVEFQTVAFWRRQTGAWDRDFARGAVAESHNWLNLIAGGTTAGLVGVNFLGGSRRLRRRRRRPVLA